MNKSSASLGSALVLILVFTIIGVAIMIISGLYTGEWLYYVAGVLFAISGASGVFVVRQLSAKIKR